MYNWAQSEPVYTGKIQAVHGREGASRVQITPGASVILPDDTDKIMWVISSDNMGFKTITAYPYGDPIEDPVEALKKPTTEPEDDTPIYVTTKEFDELKNRFDKLVAELGGKKDD